MPWSHSILNLPWMTITKMEETDPVRVEADDTGPVRCPYCTSGRLREKAPFVRRVRHESPGPSLVWLILRGYKYLCRECGRYFRQRFPGLLSYQRATEPFKSEVCQDHHDGICQNRLAQRMKLGTATMERWYHRFLARKMAERADAVCPRVLGIDEHFFTRKAGYATTFCDLRQHRVFDVVLGRSETAAGYIQSHPAIAALYQFKQELWELLRPHGLSPPACRSRVREFLERIWELKNSPFASLATLSQTLEDWQEEIARMWRLRRNNGITEGFHTKMEMISRRAFGFKNFDNYRLRVRVCCC